MKALYRGLGYFQYGKRKTRNPCDRWASSKSIQELESMFSKSMRDNMEDLDYKRVTLFASIIIREK